MTSNCSLFFSLTIILLFNSCSNRYFYVPEEANLLQLSHKNNFKTSVSLNPKNRKEFLNLQGGYSPIKHLGLFSSHFSINQTLSNGIDQTINVEYKFTKIAIGGYYFLDFKHKKTNGFLFDIYGGIGKGKYHYTHLFNDGNYSLGFNKYSIQTGIHWQRKFSSFSLVWQIGFSNYHKGALNGQVKFDQVEIYNNIKTNPIRTLNESTVQYTLGGKGIRGYAFGSLIHNHVDLSIMEVFHGVGGFGIVVDFNEFMKLIKEKKRKNNAKL